MHLGWRSYAEIGLFVFPFACGFGVVVRCYLRFVSSVAFGLARSCSGVGYFLMVIGWLLLLLYWLVVVGVCGVGVECLGLVSR